MKRGKKRVVPNLEEENLDRFAGSSDEEEEEPMAPPAPDATAFDNNDYADEKNDDYDGEDGDEKEDFPPRDEYLHDERSDGKNSGDDEDDNDEDDSSSIEEEETDAATKMANAMSRILGTNSNEKSAPASSVVLAKTFTPLQRLQQKEKEQQKAIKEKRRANRERNLTALHLPLSIATTNTIQSGGQLSVAKELEQERFHRRVATRGVVALFNAITQHQKTNNSNNDSDVSLKNKETSKLTKHGFLDKIKAAAKSKGIDEREGTNASKRAENAPDSEGNHRSSWGALKDDYMLNSKKNWDEESSDDEKESETSESDEKVDTKGSTSRKKRRVSGKQ